MRFATSRVTDGPSLDAAPLHRDTLSRVTPRPPAVLYPLDGPPLSDGLAVCPSHFGFTESQALIKPSR